MNKFFVAALLSMSPISEIRGGLPYAIFSDIPFSLALPLCIFSNFIAAIFIFLFLDFLHGSFLKFTTYEKFSSFVFSKMRKRSKNMETRIQKYGYVALALFVAIPLPITGAWTGSIISWLLGLNRKKSLLAIFLGIFSASLIVSSFLLFF